jgi:membrane-bound ClpP family serine protease
MGLLLIVLGLLLWLLAGYFVAGLILIVLGVILLFAPGPFYGYGYWHDRRGAP